MNTDLDVLVGPSCSLTEGSPLEDKSEKKKNEYRVTLDKLLKKKNAHRDHQFKFF